MTDPTPPAPAGETMLERVARAICVSFTGNDRQWKYWEKEAHAALEAIRIPDDRAIAAVEAWSRTSKTDRTWADGFTVMVDAMLGEVPRG